ncbi:hypothetical protein NEFER03_1053 [Nematocida sp. LUAm3]|nr:hypothetical protein NEFER03_1053 [Nematocida sp. LUAm3]KAI5175342.1 hypothetical protein NEFER02_1271 [Nematocida sp. LUAm2]KAI5177701.1 hypothetical protein NEFER01_0925 [Nematocida sp. LUAm1]
MEMEKKKTLRSAPKKIIKSIKRVIFFPFTKVSSYIKKKRAKALEKKKKKKEQVEKEAPKTPSPLEQLEKRVTFSPLVYIHTYRTRKKEIIPVSLKKICDSLPPHTLEGAIRLQSSKKKTALSEKILDNIDKRAEVVELFKSLVLKKHRPRKIEKRPRSKILNILDGYSEASASDSHNPNFSHSSTSESEISEEQASSHSDACSSSNNTPKASRISSSIEEEEHSDSHLEESNESNRSSISSEKPRKLRKKSKKRKTEKPQKKKEKPLKKDKKQKKRSLLNLEDDNQSSVSLKIFNFLNDHASKSSKT